MNEDKKAAVYINKPITNDADDYIGFNTYAEYLDEAMKTSDTIGIVGDYGTGKSSLIEYFKEKFLKEKFDVVSINLWSVNGGKNEENRPFEIHCHFLHQFALALLDTRDAKAINRKLNENYGLFSLHFSNSSIVFLAIGLMLFGLYSYVKPEGLSWINCILNGDDSGGALLLSIAFCVFAFVQSDITFSSWKSENKREINANDIIEINKDILDKRVKNKRPVVVVIEDLDRTTDKEKVYNFLKELNRFYVDSLTEDERNEIKFIINVKPESQLQIEATAGKNSNLINKEDIKKKSIEDTPGKDSTELPRGDTNGQRANTAISTYAYETNNFQKSIYSKVFDYTIDLFPINVSNYDVILDNLLKEKKEYLNSIDIPVVDCGNKKLPGMRRIIYGERLSLRDIKERLNAAIVLYNSLRDKAGYDDSKPAVEFEKCAYVSYLKNAFSKEFLHLYEGDKLGQVLHEYIKSGRITVSRVKELLETHDELFAEEVHAGVIDRHIDMNYKMYFYNYPKDSYIRNFCEDYVYNAIMYDKKYSPEFQEQLLKAIGTDPEIVSDSYRERKLLTDKLPLITFQNKFLFEHCIHNYLENVLENISNLIDFSENGKEDCLVFLNTLFSLEVEWGKILRLMGDDLAKTMTHALQDESIKTTLEVRKLVISFFAEDILLFKALFTSSKWPITADEIKIIYDMNRFLGLCEDQDLDIKALNSIVEVIDEIGIDTKNIDRVIRIFENATSCYDETELVKTIIKLIDLIYVVSPVLDEYIVSGVKKGVIEIDDYIKVINCSNGEGLSDNVTEYITEFDINSGINKDVAEKILLGKNNVLFITNLISAGLNMKELLNYTAYIKETIHEIYNKYTKFAFSIRTQVLQILKRNPKVLKAYSFLFETPLPIIDEVEITSVQQVDVLLTLIDEKQITKERTDYIAAALCRKPINSPSFVNRILNIIRNQPAETAKMLFYKLDFDKIRLKVVSNKRKTEFLNSIEEDFDIVSNKQEIIRFMRHVKHLIIDLEERLIGKFDNSDVFENFVALVNEANEDELSNVTFSVIKSAGRYGVYNKQVQEKLYEQELYNHYVFAKIWTDKRFDFELDKLDVLGDTYLQMIQKDHLKKTRAFMFANEKFVEFAYNKKAYITESDNLLLCFSEMMQTQELLDEVFKRDDTFIELYLLKVKRFLNKNVEQYYLSKISQKEELFLSRKIYTSIQKALSNEVVKNQYKNKRSYLRKKLKK